MNTLKFEDERDSYIISKRLPTEYLLITKGKEYLYSGQDWKTTQDELNNGVN